MDNKCLASQELKLILYRLAGEAISDEQVKRVVEPVIGMIEQSQFDKPLDKPRSL